ncbi:roadblock/LC7 domain-containing protein [Desulfamplus magnetovallimortis]|nr:roadblock/LC7 domain-containing protein [Desulfamplus magnetovallimortis]
MNYGILSEKQLKGIDNVLKVKLIDAGVKNAILIDMAGNTVSKQNDGNFNIDTVAFAALAAGNFAAVDAMAQMVGESEFSLLFHKGETASIHFSKVNENLLLITMFHKDISLGLIRLKVTETNNAINKICRNENI